jgi:hypothetical protein
MNSKNQPQPKTPETTDATPVEIDRSKLLGFDQGDESSEPGRIGAHLSAKVGDKPGRK